jgi:iron complex transport system substrate-binding protein
MRVVSLTCSNTEIVCALGCADRLVGVDDHSDFPEEVVSGLARVGKDLNVDPDKVEALRPDLVLASLTVPGHEKVVASLEERGLPLEVLQPFSIQDTYADIRRIGDLLGVRSRAEVLVTSMREVMEDVPLLEGDDRPKILVEWWPKPVIGAGARSWVHDLIEAAGGRNVLEDRDCESTPLTDEELCIAAPDAVVISWCGVPTSHYRPDVVYRREAWAQVPAVVNRQVHCISEAYLGRPGPRLVEGVQALRQLVQSLQVTS